MIDSGFEYAMIFDSDKCVGCHACEVACKQEFDAPLGFFRIMTLYADIGKYPKVKREFLTLSCRQCEDAACKKHCKSGSISERDGVVVIDTKKCNGCGDCVKACGIGAVYVNPVSKIAEKCDLCRHRGDIGLKAACESTCVADAIKIVKHKKGERPAGYLPFVAHKGEKPRSLYRGANFAVAAKLKKGKSFSGLNYEIYTWASRG